MGSSMSLYYFTYNRFVIREYIADMISPMKHFKDCYYIESTSGTISINDNSYIIIGGIGFSNFYTCCSDKTKLEELINLYILAGGVVPNIGESFNQSVVDLLVDCAKLLEEI